MYHRALSGIPSFFPLYASRYSPPPAVITKNVSRLVKCSLGAKSPLVENSLSTLKSQILEAGIEDSS